MNSDAENLLHRLIAQLDALVPFLALAHRDVFALIERDHDVWLSPDAMRTLPDSYSIYRRQVTHGAFLLGYSCCEAFLADLLRLIYMHNPRMLSEDKQLTFGELRTVRSYKAVVRSMVDKQVDSVFIKSMQGVAEHFGKTLSLPWPDQERDKAVEASLLRNCIIHNLARADSRLAQMSDYALGQNIALEPTDVHSFGLSARALARHVYARAEPAFLNKNRR